MELGQRPEASLTDISAPNVALSATSAAVHAAAAKQSQLGLCRTLGDVGAVGLDMGCVPSAEEMAVPP